MNRRIMISGIIAVLILSLLLGCGENGVSSSGSLLMPLAVDNFWAGTMTYYNLSGDSVASSLRTYRIDHTRSILNNSTQESEKWYELNVYDGGGITTTLLLRNDVDGLYRIFSNTTTGNSEIHLWRRFPCNSSELYNCYTYEVSVMATDTVISTDEGDKRCYCFRDVIRNNPDGDEMLWYFAPDIGIVGYELYIPDGEGGKFLSVRFYLTETRLL